MEFANQESSPFFEIADTENDYVASIDLDTSIKIRYVSMEVRGGLYYTGINFFDEVGSQIANLTWSESTETKETPR